TTASTGKFDNFKRYEGSMKFGTIGAGAVALAFAREALARGHEVVLSSRRGPDALADKVAELGRGASAASVDEAASLEYVLLAVPWRNVESALEGPARLERPGAHRCDESLRRDESEARPRRSRRQGRQRGSGCAGARRPHRQGVQFDRHRPIQ